MRDAKRKRLEEKGWRVGSASEFLSLSREETQYVELKLRLAQTFRTKRRRKRLTQVEVARVLGSSQSRVAKMEGGDPSVSVDLLVRALYVLGMTPRELSRVVASGPATLVGK
jgi:predicted XRE-type DNA-binding protein